MKKHLLVLVLILFSYTVYSQVLISLLFGEKLNSPGLEFGLEGGYNWSKLGSMEAKRSLASLNLGFYFDIRLKDPWYLNTGVLVKSKMGVAKLTDNDLDFLQTDRYQDAGDYSQVINYFLVPVLPKYRFKNHFYIEAGPQFGLMHNAYVYYKSDIDGKDARIKDYNKGNLNRIDAGLIGGVGYKLLKGTGMTIGIKYYYGFIDVYKNKSGSNNRGFFFKMNIPVGGVDKDEKQND